MVKENLEKAEGLLVLHGHIVRSRVEKDVRKKKTSLGSFLILGKAKQHFC